ncbi:potassium transporter Kup [Roseococcus microcysteis]|uniref:potassium transporter Kup n=1 Tax=Roseococcus microcysteis TaxID=2771361 RepID=UPI001CC39110|nr:potassium transporter Kup [Roseococcus microcysteis]
MADPLKPESRTPERAASAAALLGVLGVVYGDIGTSPLYAMRAAAHHFSHDGLERWEILGLLSLIFWSLNIVVTIKYVTFVLRADNRGEGGILALTALAQRGLTSPRAKAGAILIGMVGASLFFGDGIITPAISVLSAVEGLKVVSPAFEEAVVPLAVVVLLLLFLVQSRGTGAVGMVFGPICAVWFLVIGALGLVEIIRHPSILVALSPHYAIQFTLAYGLIAFIAFGSVVLAVTGAEALYADMGHFGRKPMRYAWLFFVLPALCLNYFGQGALLLFEPEALVNPFYLLAPEWFRLPLVVLATMATIIASQAMISGAFSIARQCVQMGFLPRLEVRHTSATEEGQIYLPQVNFLLLVGVLTLVIIFGESERLAAAYGFAVTGTFVCTTLLAAAVYHAQFRWPVALVVPVFGAFLLLDVVFFASNVLKIPDGGYVPLIVGTGIFLLMTTWQRGRDLLFARFRQDGLPLRSFIARLPQSRTLRVPGIAVFMTSQADYLPGALLHNLKHNKVLHENVLFVTVTNESIPHVGPERRREVEELAPGIHRVSLHYGFQESPNIPRELESLRELGIPFEPMQTSYFLGRETIVAAAVPRMSRWRQWLFMLMSRNAVPATEFFRIPSDRVVELGVRVAI